MTNYFRRPEVASAFLNDSVFKTPNLHSACGIEPWLVMQPTVFPEADSLSKYEFMQRSGPQMAFYDRHWTDSKSR